MSKPYVSRKRAAVLDISCSPESQQLVNMLGPLDGSEAASALLDALEKKPENVRSKLFNANIECNVARLRKRGWDRGYKTIHDELGMAADRAFRASYCSKTAKKTASEFLCGPTKRMSYNPSAFESISRPPQTTATTSTFPEATLNQTARPAKVTVSDSEDGFSSETEKPDEELVRVQVWRDLLEAVQLQLLVRGHHGFHKCFKVYQLAGPVMSTRSLNYVRNKVARSFLSLYNGSSSRRESGQCRVHVLSRGGKVWIQVNLGELVIETTTIEFVVTIIPDSALVAVSCTKPARKLVHILLSALEHSLTCSVVTGDEEAHQYGDLSGPEPLKLLETAQVMEANHAIGRYRMHAAIGARSDPVSELQIAATSSMLCRTSEDERIDRGVDVGRHAARTAVRVERAGHGQVSLVGVNQQSLLLDHDAGKNKTRKQMRESTLGLMGDCPIRNCVRWEFQGRTRANTDSWESLVASNADTTTSSSSAAPMKFKSRVMMKGSDVFGGFHELVQAGYMKSMPYYVREAPSLGSTIYVNDGAVYGTDDNDGKKQS